MTPVWALLVVVVVSSVRLDCRMDPSGYSVHIGGIPVFEGTTTAVHLGHEWFAHKGSAHDTVATLQYVRTAQVEGSDALGTWHGVDIHWLAGTVPFVTMARNYTNQAVVTFGYQLPQGAVGTNTSDGHQGSPDGTITNFPALNASFDHILSWQKAFSLGHPGPTYGPAGGPYVFYNESTQVAVMGSAATHFKISTTWHTLWDGTPATWIPGALGTLPDLPPQFTHWFVLVASDMGVTSVVHEWGSALQRWHGTHRVPDVTLQQVSYQTDNGAEYCFCDEHCDEKLLGVRATLNASGVPVGILSFQGGWWNNPNLHTPRCAPWCVTDWDVNGTKFPMGIPAFQRRFGAPLQLYAPYFCRDTPYDVQNGGKWHFSQASPDLSDCHGYTFKLPRSDTSARFYQWLFGTYGPMYHMVSYEMDFMEQSFRCVPDFLTSVSASSDWLNGMASVAQQANLPLQYCMATPSDMLHSLTTPIVTNARASNDYYYGSSYQLGLSSLLLWSLKLSPSKDTFWTTDNGQWGPQLGGCPHTGCPADHSNVGCILHTILAVYSTGPVGFSDSRGYTNATLIQRTAMTDGTVLPSSKPFTTIDRLIHQHATADASEPLQSGPSQPFIYTTHTTVPSQGGGEGYLTHALLSFGLRTPFWVAPVDLWPRPLTGSEWTVRRWDDPACVNGSHAVGTGCVRNASAVVPVSTGGNWLEVPAVPQGADPFTCTLTLLSPRCASRWTLLGQVDKFVPVSVVRFPNIQCTKSGMKATVHGALREVVDVTFVSPVDRVHVYRVVIPHSGSTNVVVTVP